MHWTSWLVSPVVMGAVGLHVRRRGSYSELLPVADQRCIQADEKLV